MIAVDSASRLTLADLPIGVAARITEIAPHAADRLVAHGLRTGALVLVERDAPFRGPRIVRLGHARIAVATSIARAVAVRPASDGDGDGPVDGP